MLLSATLLKEAKKMKEAEAKQVKLEAVIPEDCEYRSDSQELTGSA